MPSGYMTTRSAITMKSNTVHAYPHVYPEIKLDFDYEILYYISALNLFCTGVPIPSASQLVTSSGCFRIREPSTKGLQL
jgi:hypothetical protein